MENEIYNVLTSSTDGVMIGIYITIVLFGILISAFVAHACSDFQRFNKVIFAALLVVPIIAIYGSYLIDNSSKHKAAHLIDTNTIAISMNEYEQFEIRTVDKYIVFPNNVVVRISGQKACSLTADKLEALSVVLKGRKEPTVMPASAPAQ